MFGRLEDLGSLAFHMPIKQCQDVFGQNSFEHFSLVDPTPEQSSLGAKKNRCDQDAARNHRDHGRRVGRFESEKVRKANCDPMSKNAAANRDHQTPKKHRMETIREHPCDRRRNDQHRDDHDVSHRAKRDDAGHCDQCR